jgi:hypothetical protein
MICARSDTVVGKQDANLEPRSPMALAHLQSDIWNLTHSLSKFGPPVRKN